MPAVNRPVARQWQDGEKRLVQYEALFLGPGDVKMGYGLIVDLDRLEQEKSPGF